MQSKSTMEWKKDDVTMYPLFHIVTPENEFGYQLYLNENSLQEGAELSLIQYGNSVNCIKLANFMESN